MNNKETLIQDLSPSVEDFREDVLHGLSQTDKNIPSKYFYDKQGSYYFERICESKEYYVTRTEISIMKDYAREMANLIGPDCLVLEYGSGASIKTRILLDHLSFPCAYIPVDISPSCLQETALAFSEIYPSLEVLPLCADFTRPFELPRTASSFDRKLIYFPGSTIGNFPVPDAVDLLKHMHDSCTDGDLILLGIDLKKPKKILWEAYNDRQGYTASFNLNLLKRVNRELDGDFHIHHFRHLAFYNDEESRIEMHLLSTIEQTVTISGQAFHFYEGETIHTESSCKYDLRELEELALYLGFQTKHVWTDSRRFFAVLLLEIA